MRVLCLGLLLVTAWLAREAHAEKVKTNQSAKVHARPGEQSKTILTVQEGKSMTVLGKEGRWLKVRVSGRTGYVPRSKVDMADDDEIVRNTRRRSFVDGRGTKRGFTGAEGPDDRVGADAVGEDSVKTSDDGDKSGGDDGDKSGDDGDKGGGDDGGDDGDGENERLTARVSRKTDVFSEADADSEVQWVAKPNMVLFPTGNKKGKFTEVENEEGDLGYVLTSKIEMSDVGGGGGGGKMKDRQIDVRARLGVTIMSQGMRTTGAGKGVPNNYNLQTSAATVALGGAYMRPWKPKVIVGGEVVYDVAKAIPGIDVGMGKTTGVTLHNVHARGVIGYDLGKASGAMLFGRAGLRYESFQVSDATNLTSNVAKLPSEITIAPMLGVAFAMPRLTQKIGLRASIDTMLIGASMKQTRRLEDGADPSVRGAIIGIGMTYAWIKNLNITAGYDLAYSSVNFGMQVADSNRQHAAGNVSRTDIFHAVTVGVAKAF